MRCFIKSVVLAFFLVAYCLGSVPIASANDGLFSEVAMESVFAASVSKKVEKSKKEIEEKSLRENRLKKLAALFDAAESKLTSASPAPSPSLQSKMIGRWSATLPGSQIFAIELTGEKKFNLVHLSKGKSTVSSGLFVVAGNQLTLGSTGATPLTSEIAFTGLDLFQMKLGEIQLNFKRAK